ncbi:hypothetical protein F2P81_006744 [Scophthalmus maximus]|uniref:Uncharacterized protein n=1 Tax=Scophthalmus maximus TaxID=52904 RepID=A0A6A4T039_SCOMX|nr:hypothetical protein F2P81_006744 [Scophthalmus maximus]
MSKFADMCVLTFCSFGKGSGDFHFRSESSFSQRQTFVLIATLYPPVNIRNSANVSSEDDNTETERRRREQEVGSLGDLDGAEDNAPDDHSLSGEEGGVSDPEESVEGDSCSPPTYTPLYNEEPRTQDERGGGGANNGDRDERGPIHSGGEEEDGEEDEEEASRWRGPVVAAIVHVHVHDKWFFFTACHDDTFPHKPDEREGNVNRLLVGNKQGLSPGSVGDIPHRLSLSGSGDQKVF